MMLQDYKWVIFILEGIGVTIQYSLLAVFTGFFVGGLIAIMAISQLKFLKYFARAYVSVLRGTPVLLQLSIWYFVVPKVINMNIPALIAGTIAFSINSSAYIAEIVRAGIRSVDKGQMEAAHTLGVSKFDALLDIVIPQAISNMLPALVNEFISMIKETAVIGMIGVHDLTRRAQLVAAEKYDYFGPMFVAAAGYYTLILVLTFIGKWLEKEMNRGYE